MFNKLQTYILSQFTDVNYTKNDCIYLKIHLILMTFISTFIPNLNLLNLKKLILL
jgi:hypothetical protein